MRRRQFLRTALAGVTGFGLGCGASEKRTVEPGPEHFPQSVASGDPRPESVILWTRVALDDGSDELDVELELFTDEALQHPARWHDGPRQVVSASAEHDHCVKVRVTGLEPDTPYWYRFVVQHQGRWLASRTGRCRTAPAADSDRAIRFAFVACQDFGGRYYNGYAHLLTQPEVDFFVHLGDYIYETAGDAGFQGGSAGREVVFEDAAGVLEVSRPGGGGFQAARSLDNYRQLYRLFRSDRALQQVHERMPMLAIWDDHEFSDDCWGATATYQDGRVDETDLERRSNANLAWFEYMPVDYDDTEFEYDTAVAPPDDIRIHRSFRFGRHVQLVLTDLRSHRSDHLIPEDAYPGAVVLTEAALQASGGIPDDASPYVEDIDGFGDGSVAQALRDAADAAGYPSGMVTGPIHAGWINDVIAESGAAVDPIDEATLATLPRGYAYTDMMKGSLWGRIGSRYLVARDPFARLAAARWTESGGESEQAMGEQQQQWFLDAMRTAQTTWKVWGNEFCLTPLQIDLSLLSVPASFKRVFHINVDDWNGMGNRRDELLRELATIPNVVAITGDIHAFFAATPWVRDDDSKSIVEFVTSSISSTTFQRLLQNQVESDPVLSNVSGASALAGAIRDLLLLAPDGPNPQLAHADVTSHGYAIVEADAAALQVTFFAHPDAEAMVEHYDDPELDALFTPAYFRVDAGSRALWQRFGETWKRWDPPTQRWV
jgi:alkaline phosphatase D